MTCDRHNEHLAEKYALMEKNEVRWEGEGVRGRRV